MYTNFYDLVKATRDKYANATSLARPPFHGDGGFYGHGYNGLGCAIGCHFSPELADRLDEINDSDFSYYAIFDILSCDKEKSAIIHEVISPDIPIDHLRMLQSWHDRADGVEDFLDNLDRWIEENAPEVDNHA